MLDPLDHLVQLLLFEGLVAEVLIQRGIIAQELVPHGPQIWVQVIDVNVAILLVEGRSLWTSLWKHSGLLVLKLWWLLGPS
jgi:hypothetical protein